MDLKLKHHRGAIGKKHARIIVDSRDASQDIIIPAALAMSMYDNGQLLQDPQNGGFCLPDFPMYSTRVAFINKLRANQIS